MNTVQPALKSDAQIEAIIRERLPLAPAPALPHILIHQAIPNSGLGRIAQDRSPFWAYCWPGGLALARYIFANPQLAKGKKVLDLGTGSGLVAIAAAKAGASEVTAIDIDPRAIIAARLNAKANGVSLKIRCLDILDSEPLDSDLVTAGDLFYDQRLAKRALACLTRYHAKGINVLIGDPGRAHLPAPNLARVAAYLARDIGAAAPMLKKESGVYKLAWSCPRAVS
jgi:predicted nicotinamide N-methyase